MKTQPFSVILSVVSGDPNGLRVVEHSDWYGKALIFPRTLLPYIIGNREESMKSAVYLLIGPNDEEGGEMLYIGEADPVGDRLQNHYANKDFWTKSIFFTGSGDQLNKTHVKYLESRLVQLGYQAKRYKIENKTFPSLPSVSEHEKIRAEGFLSHVLEILPLLGVSAFEHSDTIRSTQSDVRNTDDPALVSTSGEPLILRGKGIEAHGAESNAGFVVRQGSKAVAASVPSMETRVGSYFQLRQSLISQNVLCSLGDELEFTQDYIFESPSAAAAVILGRSTNGRVEWKTLNGRTLKSVQEASSTRSLA